MNRDDVTLLKVLGASVGCVGLIIFLFTWALLSFEERKCESYGDVTGYEVKVAFGGTCMVKDPENGWMSMDERTGRKAKR